jgi:two-component system, LytTR family, response regulator LytT
MQSEKIILIVEDELLIGESIANILSNEGYRNTNIVSSVDKAIEAIKKEKPDLVITDINLGSEKSGIDLGHVLYNDYKIPFIYITSHSSSRIVQQAKHTLPSAYLTKPFKKEDILVALELAFFQPEECLVVKDGFSTTKIQYREIGWLKAEKNYTAIHMVSGRITLVREPLTEVHNRLPTREFIRVHKSYVINQSCIVKIKTSSVQLSNSEIPVGRTYRGALQELLRK